MWVCVGGVGWNVRRVKGTYPSIRLCVCSGGTRVHTRVFQTKSDLVLGHPRVDIPGWKCQNKDKENEGRESELSGPSFR